MQNRPLLLVDVDGPLNPYLGKPTKRPAGYLTHRKPYYDAYASKWREMRVWLNPEHGPMLTEFAKKNNMELVWATTWQHEANSWIGPKIGLTEEWPVIEFPIEELKNNQIWKFAAVEKFAEDRDVIWLDDQFDDYKWARDGFKLKRSNFANTKLHHVSPRVGITEDDLKAINAWLVTGWQYK